jgi:hypothetical protein
MLFQLYIFLVKIAKKTLKLSQVSFIDSKPNQGKETQMEILILTMELKKRWI